MVVSSGDLRVEIEERRHDEFTREGLDVYHELYISFPDATLGTEVEVPTLQRGERGYKSMLESSPVKSCVCVNVVFLILNQEEKEIRWYVSTYGRRLALTDEEMENPRKMEGSFFVRAGS